MKLTHSAGRKIELEETDDPAKLKNQLALLGMNGLAYTPIWNKIAKKLDEIKTKKAKDVNNLAFVVYVIISVMLAILGATGFYNGFHNADLAMNLNNIRLEGTIADIKYFKADLMKAQNINNLVDIGSDFVERNPVDLYILGVNQMKQAVQKILAAFALLLTLCLCYRLKLLES